MNKAEYKALERLFDAEVISAAAGNPMLAIVQSKSKVYDKLEGNGWVQKISKTFGIVTVRGWGLTLTGHAMYCLSCPEPPSQAK